MIRLLSAGAAAVLLLLAVGAVPAAAMTPDPTLVPQLPLSATLGYAWTASAVPPATMRAAVTAGAGDATASRRSNAGTFVYDAASANAVTYGGSSPCVATWIACTSRSSALSFAMWIRENGHRYDWGTLRWCEVAGTTDGCFLAEAAALHEFGHVDALAHHNPLPDDSEYLDSVMNPVSRARPKAGWDARAFARCDTATLQVLYGVQAWTTPYSTCLDVPTTLSLVASPLTVSLPGTVTFTAQLLSSGTGRLGGNPMSGRTVVLQQRSGSGWADLATMIAGPSAGSYRVSMAPRGSQDYRATFRKPSGEGVRTSVSGVVSVTVLCAGRPCPLVAGSAQ